MTQPRYPIAERLGADKALSALQPTTDAQSRLARIAITAMLLPILVFYGLLARYVVNIPYWDDYGVLDFLEHYVALPTGIAKFGYIVGAQHNEYKTIFANAVVALQYTLSGHANFIVLSWAGNVFVFILFYLLWRHFFTSERDTSQRLLLFVPVAYLLFQLQYAETLNWSMPGLQNIPVLIFAFASIACLARENSRSFLFACGFMVLAIASSGNGFALAPIGVAMLFRRKAIVRIAAWIVLAVGCATIYFHHYNFHSSQQDPNASVVHSAHSINPIFTLSFMGSALGNTIPLVKGISILLGLAICAAFLWMVKKRYDRLNPTLFYFTAFVVLTAVAVSGFRSKLGFPASVVGRYKIYSDLLLICCYAFLIEIYPGAPLRRKYFQAALALSVLFCMWFDYSGGRYMAARYRDMVAGAMLYKTSHQQRGPVVSDGDEYSPTAVWMNGWTRRMAQNAESTGIYQFP